MNELIAGYASYASTEAILHEQGARLMDEHGSVTITISLTVTVSWSWSWTY